MADGYQSKKPIVSNCAIILLRDDMQVSYLLVVVCNQSLERVSLDKVVVGMLVAILTEAKSLFSTFTRNIATVTSRANPQLK